MDSLKKEVQKVVNDIYHENGEVRPSVLIECATPKDSPIHNAFEWDNKKAGHEYRLIQARTWIRKVEIIIDDRRERLVHVPLIKVDGAVDEVTVGENYYKPISVICSDADEYDLALNETLARLNSAKVAYSQLKTCFNASKQNKKPDFKHADRGFAMVEQALRA